MKKLIIVLLALALNVHAEPLNPLRTLTTGMRAPIVVAWSDKSPIFDNSLAVTQYNQLQPQYTLNAIDLQKGGKTMVSISMDGKVKFGEGMTTDEASREFWLSVARWVQFPTCRRGR